MEEAINYIAGLPVEGVAGKTFRYSNIGLQLLAAVIEKISKQQFQDVFDDRIAQPLGMLHTDWGEGKIPLAAGGARSTASDYLQFTIMILNKGVYQQKKILQENSIAKMQVNRIDSSVAIMYSPAETGKWGYGFGEWVMKEASENKTSNGVSSPGLFGTFPWVDNTRNYSAVLLTLNLKNKNRLQLYTAVKALADKLVTTE
jgi:CubicO group peptidase (beta-lactamase class C family)